MATPKKQLVLLLCLLIILATAAFEYLHPSLSFFDGGLLITIMLTVFLKKDRYTCLFGGLSMALLILAAFYYREDLLRRHLLPQYLFSLFILALALAFTLYLKKLYRNTEADLQQFKALFEHATEGIILTDDQGRIVLLNPAGAQMFRYTPDELPGQPIDLLIPQRFYHTHAVDRQQFYQHPGNRTMGHGRDLYARKKDGTEFPVEVSLSHYRQHDKLFVIAFIVDITPRKNAEQELVLRQQQLGQITEDVRRLNTELENKVEQRTIILREALHELERSREELTEALSKEKELNEIKSRFVVMASHEFRTPLSTILSSAHILSRYTGADDQDKRDKHIQRTKDAVKHLNDLLEDFLSLGRLEEGKVSPEPAGFLLRDFLEELTEEMQSLAKPDQAIHCPYTDGQVLYTDKRLLKNTLVTLLSNAIKFSAEGAPIYLETVHLPGERLRITVRDNGIGISDEDQQHLFSSFFRGTNAVNIDGTGLGLHIARRYMDLLQGSISIQSAVDAGTTVTIELPEKLA